MKKGRREAVERGDPSSFPPPSRLSDNVKRVERLPKESEEKWRCEPGAEFMAAAAERVTRGDCNFSPSTFPYSFPRFDPLPPFPAMKIYISTLRKLVVRKRRGIGDERRGGGRVINESIERKRKRGRGWTLLEIEGRKGRRERERVVLPWGRGVGAWGRLVGPGVGARIRCTGAGRRRCPPSMDHQDPYPRRFHLKQERSDLNIDHHLYNSYSTNSDT